MRAAFILHAVLVGFAAITAFVAALPLSVSRDVQTGIPRARSINARDSAGSVADRQPTAQDDGIGRVSSAIHLPPPSHVGLTVGQKAGLALGTTGGAVVASAAYKHAHAAPALRRVAAGEPGTPAFLEEVFGPLPASKQAWLNEFRFFEDETGTVIKDKLTPVGATLANFELRRVSGEWPAV